VSEEFPAADVRALCTSRLALSKRFDELRSALEHDSGAGRVSAARAFETELHRRTGIERRLLLPLLTRSSVPGRDARREIETQHTQLGDLARHLHERVASGAAQGVLLGLIENLSRRLVAHASELDVVYFPAIAPLLAEDDRRALASNG
jgi:hypothetical protein